MRCACWIPKATNVLSECVIPAFLPLQDWLRERAWTLHYTSIACLVILNLVLLSLALLQICIPSSSIFLSFYSSFCFLTVYLSSSSFTSYFAPQFPSDETGRSRTRREATRYRWEYNIKIVAVPRLRRLVADLSSRRPGFRSVQVHAGFFFFGGLSGTRTSFSRSATFSLCQFYSRSTPLSRVHISPL